MWGLYLHSLGGRWLEGLWRLREKGKEKKEQSLVTQQQVTAGNRDCQWEVAHRGLAKNLKHQIFHFRFFTLIYCLVIPFSYTENFSKSLFHTTFFVVVSGALERYRSWSSCRKKQGSKLGNWEFKKQKVVSLPENLGNLGKITGPCIIRGLGIKPMCLATNGKYYPQKTGRLWNIQFIFSQKKM